MIQNRLLLTLLINMISVNHAYSSQNQTHETSGAINPLTSQYIRFRSSSRDMSAMNVSATGSMTHPTEEDLEKALDQHTFRHHWFNGIEPSDAPTEQLSVWLIEARGSNGRLIRDVSMQKRSCQLNLKKNPSIPQQAQTIPVPSKKAQLETPPATKKSSNWFAVFFGSCCSDSKTAS